LCQIQVTNVSTMIAVHATTTHVEFLKPVEDWRRSGDGCEVGERVGPGVGPDDGAPVGVVKNSEGELVGTAVGSGEGSAVGVAEGSAVGVA